MAGPRNNLRPQDILLAAKIAVIGSKSWNQKLIASELNLSQTEIAFSLKRLKTHKLLDEDQTIKRAALYEFLVHGLKYVFPLVVGPKGRGIKTALSFGSMQKIFRLSESDTMVWPDPDGNVRGQLIEPLYNTVPFASKNDEKLYELMSLIDVIRLGGSRQTKLASANLYKILLGGTHG